MLSQQAYLKASNTGADDRLGFSVSLSGDTAVVGAIFEDSNTSGVDGLSNELARRAGAAYVFFRQSQTWTQQAFLKASNPDENDQFGWSVSISGDTIVVGAKLESSSTSGVNTTPDNNLNAVGAAYVFVRNGSEWVEQAYLKPSNPSEVDVFGEAVAIFGDTVVVGARLEDSSAQNSGAAYVFQRTGDSWEQQAILKASNVGQDDNFGHSVAIHGDVIVVGSIFEGSSSAGVNSFPNESADNAGAAYVYRRASGSWAQEAYVKPLNPGAGDQFGWSVAAAQGYIAVGSPGEDSGSTGVNGVVDESGSGSGAVYLFAYASGQWTQSDFVKPHFQPGNNFGEDVALVNDVLVVGERLEDSSGTGVNGLRDTAASNSGAAYVYRRANGSWVEGEYLKPLNTDAGDHFGSGVAASNETILIGAAREGSSSNGVDGFPDNNASEAGAAYVFDPAGAAAPSFFVSGTVDGLAGVGLELQNNGADNLIVDFNGTFTFPRPIGDAFDYEVTVLTPPEGPNDLCSVTNAVGVIDGANVTNVLIACEGDTPNPILVCHEEPVLISENAAVPTIVDFPGLTEVFPELSNMALSELKISLDIDHPAVNLLTAILGNPASNESIALFDRMSPANQTVCPPNIDFTVSASGLYDLSTCDVEHPSPNGFGVRPIEAISTFRNRRLSELNLSLEIYNQSGAGGPVPGTLLETCLMAGWHNPENAAPSEVARDNLPAGAAFSALTPVIVGKPRPGEPIVYGDHAVVGHASQEPFDVGWVSFVLEEGVNYVFAQRAPESNNNFSARVELFSPEIAATGAGNSFIDLGCIPEDPLGSAQNNAFSFLSATRSTVFMRVTECTGKHGPNMGAAIEVRPPAELQPDGDSCPPGIFCKPTGVVGGMVSDNVSGEGLAAAIIGSDGSFSFSSLDGGYASALTEGQVMLTYISQGYETSTETIFVVAESSASLDHQMTPTATNSPLSMFLFQSGFESD